MNAALTALVRSRWLGAAAGVALVGVTLALRLGLGFREGDAPLALLFVFPVMLAASVGGWPGGLAATAAAALATDYLLMAPVGSLAIARTDNRVAWLALWGVGAMATLLVERSRRARLRAEGREREARHVADRLSLFVEHAPAAVALFDRQMRYLAASARYVHDYRLTTRDLVGRSHYDLFPEIPERWKELHRRCLAGAVERCEEDPFPRGDGTVDWVRWELRPWRDAAGGIGGVVLFSEVITEAKRAREREVEADQTLRRADARARAIFEQAAVGVAHVEPGTGRFVEVNARFCELLGYSREEVLARGWRDVTHPDDLAASEAVVLRGERTGEPFGAEKRYQRKDGTPLWAHLTVSPIVLPGQETTGLLAILVDITEQKRVEETVRARRALEDQVARIASSVPGVIHSFRRRPDGSMSMPFATPAAEAVLGVSIEDLARDAGWHERIDARDRQRMAAGMAASARQLSAYHELFRYQHPGRGSRWLEIWSEPVREADGATVWHGYMADVTDHRTAVDALQRSEALLRAFSDAIPDPIFVKARDGRWIFANPGLLAAVGRRADEVLGRTDREIYGDAGIADALMETDARIMSSGVPEIVEERVETPQGIRVFLSTKVPHRSAAGEVIGLIGAARDITERKRMEEALQRSEERFRALIENSSDVVVVLDATMNVSFWSPSAAEQLGWTDQEAAARGVAELVHPDDRARSTELLHTALATAGGTVRFVRRQLHRGALRVVDVSIRNLLHAPAVRGVVYTMRDITEQRRLTEQVQQSQKLESIGRLAGGVAHDFNNLLTVILSCCDTLKDDLGSAAAETRDDVEQIRAAGERARDLTRQLLAFARKQVIAPVALDLNAVVRGSEKMLGRLLGEDVALEVAPGAALWPLHADPGQLEQVIVNLAVNARDAMPSGGVLRLETRNVTVASADSPRTGDPAGDWIRLTVRDSGVGMAPDVRAHLFEPFFTTKGKGKGTGLGLATVYGIVEQAGGYVHVESAPGQGSTFEISLPRSTAPAPGGSPRATPRQDPRGTETILVAEDDPLVRGVIVRALGAAGYRVLEAQSGRDALARVADHPGPIHLVVSDVVMPGMNGRELVERLRQLRTEVRALYVSGYSDEVVSHHGVLDAGVELLPKPFTPAALLERVRRVLDTARPGGARTPDSRPEPLP